MAIKKLIEVALPLDKINAESAREKSIRHGHPSTLHLWWARRPLAAARAVIWSSLVDDPSSHPELFPTEEAQNAERKRLFKILEDLVVWENSNNEEVLKAARNEILRSTNGNPPALLDPFAGGGAIPLEAQRLGLEAHAHDLNPVAVMINKAMIEIPPKFANMPPVNPEDRVNRVADTWKGAQGLAADVKYYGEWMKKEAYKRIGHLYPKVRVPKEQGGGEATVIAWIWARTVKCPNPACGCEMPLANGFILSKKKGAEAYIEPILDYKGKKITYKVVYGNIKNAVSPKLSRGAKFKCILCNEVTSEEYIKAQALRGKMGSALLGVVAEGKSGRLYISPNVEHIKASNISKPDTYPDASLPYDPRNIWCVNYGLDTYDKLFTPRQLTCLITLSDLISEVQTRVKNDAIVVKMKNDHISLSNDGDGAEAYGEAIGVFLALAVDRQADIGSSVASWISSIGAIRNTFGRQAIPMSWDYAEGNPFSNSTGCFDNMVNWVVKCISLLPAGTNGFSMQYDAQSDCNLRNFMVSTDPPYYDNIGYANLSDFFYVWLRRSLRRTYPDLFKTLLVPKEEELIATPYRHEGSTEKAKHFFEEGMLSTCRQIFQYSRNDIPVTIYYAYKQSDNDESGMASTGWETIFI